jgi:hypothetical protein
VKRARKLKRRLERRRQDYDKYMSSQRHPGQYTKPGSNKK